MTGRGRRIGASKKTMIFYNGALIASILALNVNVGREGDLERMS
jgi:hypothetical protein